MQLDKAYTTEKNLPTPRRASNQCNEGFRQQHTFPFPQQNCLLPTYQPAIWGLNRMHTINLRITGKTQKVKNYYRLRFPCARL